MEEEISLVELFSILRKRLGMIIGLSLFGLLLSFVLTFYVITPQYSATTQMLVTHTETSQPIQQSDLNINLQLINTYKDIIKGPVILDDVREELGLDLTQNQLSSKVEVIRDASSQVFSVKVTDSTPYRAAEIANKTAQVFQENIDAIMNVDNVTVISVAIPEMNPVSPNQVLNLAVGLLLGLITSIGLAFVLEFLDMTVKDPKFVTEEVGWTNLGSVSIMTKEELMLEAVVPKKDVSSHQTRSRV